MVRTALLVFGGAIVAGSVLLARADELTPQLSAAFQNKMQGVMKKMKGGGLMKMMKRMGGGGFPGLK